MKRINLNRDIESRAAIASRIYSTHKVQPEPAKEVVVDKLKRAEKPENPKREKDVLEVQKNKSK